MELQVAPYVDQLLQLFLMTIKDQDDEVISNSVFALGVLAESGKESVVKYYTNLLQTFISIANDNPSDLVKDNICGAVARFIMTGLNDLPLPQVTL